MQFPLNLARKRQTKVTPYAGQKAKSEPEQLISNGFFRLPGAGSRLLCSLFPGFFHCAATLSTHSNDAQQVLGHLEAMLCGHRILKRFQLGGEKLDDPPTLRANHVIVMLMFVIVFVVSAPVSKANLAREPGLGQQLQRSIHRCLPDAGVFLPHQAIKVFAGEVCFGAQKYVENEVPLRRALESLLLDVLEKNFLLFSHGLGDLAVAILTSDIRLILHSETITVKTTRPLG